MVIDGESMVRKSLKAIQIQGFVSFFVLNFSYKEALIYLKRVMHAGAITSAPSQDVA